MTRIELLEILQTGEIVSGPELGRRFGISRAAVSKAAAGLKKEGYPVSSVPNRGYRLEGPSRRISPTGIRLCLGDHPWASRVKVLRMVDSTNNYLKALAAEGAPQGTVAVADWQTAGRGRLGRRFDSPPGTGIYLSVLLRPGCPAGELMTLTAQAAVAVRRAVAAVCGAELGIKWVNDLVLGGKKLCGILTELSFEAESGLVGYAVVGVGINCNRTEAQFSPALREIAGSLLTQTGQPVDRTRLAAELIRSLSELPKLDWRAEYRAACVNLGRQVQILSPGQPPRSGVAEDVGDLAELLVRLPDGSLETVNAGEVSVRGLYGYLPENDK